MLFKNAASITAMKGVVKELRSKGVKIIRNPKDITYPENTKIIDKIKFNLAVRLQGPSYLPGTDDIFIPRKSTRFVKHHKQLDSMKPTDILLHEAGHAIDPNATSSAMLTREGVANRNAVGLLKKYESPGKLKESVKEFERTMARPQYKNYRNILVGANLRDAKIRKAIKDKKFKTLFEKPSFKEKKEALRGVPNYLGELKRKKEIVGGFEKIRFNKKTFSSKKQLSGKSSKYLGEFKRNRIKG